MICVRVLIAPDCFTGTLSAPQAAAAVADGWRRQAPGDELELLPLSDGGPGFVDVLHAALGGELLQVTVPGPLGDPAPAVILLTSAEAAPSAAPEEAGDDGGDAGDGGGGVTRTAYVESAQACGSHLVPDGRRDPGRATTAGVGRLLGEARAAGATRIVVGLGGSGTNDAGAGALLAAADAAGVDLPARLRDLLGHGGAGLHGATASDLAPLNDVRAAWADTTIVVATDVDAPLLGPHGASLGFGPQKGASPDQAKDLESALMGFAGSAIAATGVPQRMVATPGAGAAGGLGFGLMLLGGLRSPGIDAVADAVRLRERIAATDLVITGEGKLDWQSLQGKVVAGVAALGLEAGVPVIAVAGQVEVGRRELLNLGIESAYPLARTPEQVRLALADPAGTLTDRAARVARTWTRPG
jgi:glycerate 2-kinase